MIAQSTSAAEPVGSFSLETYQIKALTLLQPMEVATNDQVEQVSEAWRITVTGDPFQVGALFYTTWVDDTPLGPAKEKVDLSGVDVIVFDKSVLRDGATISVSYGSDDAAHIAFPEPLRLIENP